MRTYSADPSYQLIELADLQQDPPSEAVRADLQSAQTITQWAHTYLCQPHAELGRGGPVCPWVPGSLQSQLFFVTVKHGHDLTRADIYRTVLTYRDWFLEIEPRTGQSMFFKTIVIVFPDIATEDAPQLIDATQRDLKSAFVAEGLMVGQFHQLPPQDAGLWNPDFRPLRSPLPLLAIRHMVPTDFPFLTKESSFVASYLKVYGTAVPKKLEEFVAQMTLHFGLKQPPTDTDATDAS